MADQSEPIKIKRRKVNIKYPEPFEVELPPVDRAETIERTRQKPVTAPQPEAPTTELPEVFEKRIVPLTGREVPLIPKSFKTKVGLTREEVEVRFHLAFELIGGVERFALWADANPTEFYRIYGKMLPSADVQQPQQQAIQINLAGGMAIPESPLDAVTLKDESAVNQQWSPDGNEE